MADKLLDRLKKLGKQILEWWKKFTRRQQIIIAGVTVGVIVAMFILVGILSQSKYTPLITAETSSDGAEVQSILEEAGVNYQVSANGLTFSVEKGQEAKANLALGGAGYESNDYADLNSILSGGFSTTEADKQKKYLKYMEEQMISDLKAYSFVKDATVNLCIPENDGTLISKQQESSAAIILTLKSDISTDTAQSIAKFVSTALGNVTTDNITIMDSVGNLYFAGSDDASVSGTASSQLTVRKQTNNLTEAEVLNVLVGLGEFSSISVAPNMAIDFAYGEDAKHTYASQDGSKESVYSQKNEYAAESTSGDGGVPGTTSNTDDGTSYVLADGTEESTTETENSYYYLPDEYTSFRTIPSGVINRTDSTIAVTTVSYNVVKEEDAKSRGLLGDLTWDEYKLTNSGRTKLDVDEDWVNTVAMATGIPAENISFVAYSENWFVDKEGLNIKATDVVTVILIVLILGLLAFVVIRSMKNVKQQEQEEELSVESLLQSTQDLPIENIEIEEKSNARRSIEKFVDENPDAVANLLRNWLSEDWG